jgi:hypothetical protein
LRAPDWTMFVPPLHRPDFGFDIPGLSTMYPNVHLIRFFAP